MAARLVRVSCLSFYFLLLSLVVISCLFVFWHNVSDQDSVDLFMRELSERFIVEEGEAKPADCLLGIAVVV